MKKNTSSLLVFIAFFLVIPGFSHARESVSRVISSTSSTARASAAVVVNHPAVDTSTSIIAPTPRPEMIEPTPPPPVITPTPRPILPTPIPVEQVQLEVESAVIDNSPRDVEPNVSISPRTKFLLDSPEEVRTEDDLNVYSRGLVTVNQNIRKIGVSNGGVQIEYSQPARLLGFVPWGYRVKLDVSQEGNVKVKLPWYFSLMKKGFDPFELPLEIEHSLKQSKIEDMNQLSLMMRSLTDVLKIKYDIARIETKYLYKK